MRATQLARFRIWPCCKINNGLHAGNLIANGSAPPGDGVLSGRIVTDTVCIDTQGTTGCDGSYQVITLRNDDQLRKIEDPFRPQAGLVGVKAADISNHPVLGHAIPNQVIAHGGGLIELRRQVITRDDDHLNSAGVKKPLGKIEAGRQERGRRAVRIDLCSENQSHRRRWHIGLCIDVTGGC